MVFHFLSSQLPQLIFQIILNAGVLINAQNQMCSRMILTQQNALIVVAKVQAAAGLHTVSASYVKYVNPAKGHAMFVSQVQNSVM